jgi:hypothetical protein
MHRGRETARKVDPVLARLLRALNDLVVDVRDVADVGHLQPARAQVTLHQIEHGEHARVADMNVVVNCDPADVHPHFTGIQRLEAGLPAGERIMDGEHAFAACGAPSPAA